MNSPTDSLEQWVKSLPYSRISHPESFLDRIKFVYWRLYTPFHPTFRDFFVNIGLLNHSKRQNFLIGTLAPGQSVQDLVSHLISQGFGNHFVAWRDDGELVSLRRLESFEYQYHLRIFEDGEIRGHYEYTPESHPWKHFKAVRQENCSDEFRRLLGNRINIGSSK